VLTRWQTVILIPTAPVVKVDQERHTVCPQWLGILLSIKNM
jgi:hypothetical protein